LTCDQPKINHFIFTDVVIGWARGFANQLQPTSSRDRTVSISSYQSTGEVNEAADIHSSDDQITPPTGNNLTSHIL